MKIKPFTASALTLFKESAAKWSEDNAMRLGAALSYYTVFSLGPLLVLATGIVGLVFGREAANGELAYQIEGLVGKQGAQAIQAVVASAHKGSEDVIASIVGLVILLFGASGVFVELKSALNKVWGAQPKKTTGVMSFIKDRLLSFAMVLSIGFLLLVSLILNAVIAAAGKYFGGFLPASEMLLHTANLLASFGVVTLLFALIYKILPETDIRWKDVWVGAALTSLLFSFGKMLIGMYLGKTSIASTFGASASVVVVMVWAYYSSLILFLGAEFTYVYSKHHGSRRDVHPEVAPQAPAPPAPPKPKFQLA